MSDHSPSCDDVQEKLYAYANDGLSAAEAATVAAHLEGCVDCCGALEALGEIDQLLRRTLGEHKRRRPSATPKVMHRIESGMSDSMRRLSRRHIRAARPSQTPLIAVIALFAMMTLLLAIAFRAKPDMVTISGTLNDPSFKHVDIYVGGKLNQTVELEGGRFTFHIPVTVGEVVIKSTDAKGNVIQRVMKISHKKK